MSLLITTFLFFGYHPLPILRDPPIVQGWCPDDDPNHCTHLPPK